MLESFVSIFPLPETYFMALLSAKSPPNGPIESFSHKSGRLARDCQPPVLLFGRWGGVGRRDEFHRPRKGIPIFVSCFTIPVRPMKSTINYRAIAVCIAIHGLFGLVWYHWLFPAGSTASLATAVPAHDANGAHAMIAGAAFPMTGLPTALMPYVYALVMSFMMAFLMAWLCGRMRVRTALGGARLALVVGVSTFLIGYATTYRFSGRPSGQALIDGLFPLLSLMIMGAILGSWRTATRQLLDLQRR